MIQRRALVQLGVASAVLGSSSVVRAQSRTARVVVGFVPGALGDLFARHTADGLKAAGYADAAFVENKPGGGGRLAIEAVKASRPDGLTLLQQPSSLMTILPHAYKVRPYDPFKDFIPAGAFGAFDICLAINPKLIPVETVAQYVDYVKRHPKDGKYGTGGIGSGPHLLGFRFGRAANARIEHVPYRGGPAAFQDLLAGQIPAYLGAFGKNVTDAHEDGRLRVLATVGPKRNPTTPNISTLAESGFPDLIYSEFTGIWLAANTPMAQVEKLNAVLVEMNKDTEFLHRWANTPLPLTQAQIAERIRVEYEANAALVKEVGFTINAS